jgi:ATP-binding cassette subfamily B protein
VNVLGNFWAALAVTWSASRRQVLLLVAATAIGGIAPVVTAWITRLVLDSLSTQGGVSHVVAGRVAQWALLLGGAGLVSAALPQTQNYAGNNLRRRLGLHLQDRAYQALNAFPGLRRHEDPRFMDKLRLALDAGPNGPSQLVGGVSRVAQAVLTAATFLISLVAINPVLGIVVIAAAVPTLVAQVAMGRQEAGLQLRLSPAARRQLFYRQLQTEAQAAKEVRLFGLGDFMRKRMFRELRDINDAQQALDRRVVRTQMCLAVLSAVIGAAGLIWTVEEVAAGHLLVGDVSMLIMATAGTQSSVATAATSLAVCFKASVLFGHYREIVSVGPDLPVPHHPAPVPRLERGVELRDVWFRYDGRRPWVLAGVNLMIPAGESVALVGVNGSGKSTVVKLLARLYDPEQGQVLWDGIDIREFSPGELRQHMGAVFQDYMTYDLTAGENIGIGDLARAGDPKEVRRSAYLAGVAETIERYPAGYETLLSRIFVDPSAVGGGYQGVMPSGGEWQRLALARAFMRRNSDLLILDEPNSGLDAEAEHSIHKRLTELRQEKTSLLISHRLNAVRGAGLIYVLSAGHVTETGSHDQLMALRGEYQRLFSLQAKGYEDLPVLLRAHRSID